MSSEERPEWMTKISSTVDVEDYLLGRQIDTTFELCQKEKAEQARKDRLELIAKDKIRLTGDPLLDLERKKHALRMEFLSNPIKMRQLRERLLKEDQERQIAKDDNPEKSPARSINSREHDRRSHNGSILWNERIGHRTPTDRETFDKRSHRKDSRHHDRDVRSSDRKPERSRRSKSPHGRSNHDHHRHHRDERHHKSDRSYNDRETRDRSRSRQDKSRRRDLSPHHKSSHHRA